MDEILGTVLYILGALVLIGSSYLHARTGKTLATVSRQQPDLLRELVGYLPESRGTDPQLLERLEELDLRLRNLTRSMADLDESTERRFRRMSARARRADSLETEAEESSPTTPPRDPRQHLLDLAHSGPASPPESQTQALPPLIRRAR